MLWRPGILASAAVMGKAPAVVYDTDAQAYFTAVEGAGGTINAAGKTAYNNLIVGLKADSLWTRLDRLWCWCAQDAIAAVRDVKAIQSATPTASPTFTTKTGYDFNGSTQYFDSGFAPSTAGGAYTQNSAHIGVWCLDDVPLSSNLDMGASAAGAAPFARICARSSGAVAMTCILNSGTTFTANHTVSTSVGHSLFSRTASNLTTAYKDGASLTTDATASTGLPSNNIFIGANNTGSAGSFSTRAQAFCHFGSGLDATQAGNLYTRLNTFKTAMAAS